MRLGRVHTNRRLHCFLRRRRQLLFLILESKRAIIAEAPPPQGAGGVQLTVGASAQLGNCSTDRFSIHAQLDFHKVSNNSWACWRNRRAKFEPTPSQRDQFTTQNKCPKTISQMKTCGRFGGNLRKSKQVPPADLYFSFHDGFSRSYVDYPTGHV